MQMAQNIGCLGELDAVVIHADGTRERRRILARDKLTGFARRLSKVFKRMIRRYGLVTAGAILASLVGMGHLPVCSLPVAGLVTNAGVDYMATDFTSALASPRIGAFQYHDSGTGTTAAAVTDTALQTGTGNARVAGTASNPSANIYQSVATLPYTATAAITEWGLFSASTTGTLWDHRVFAAINVVNGDSIQFTYKLTIASGGS